MKTKSKLKFKVQIVSVTENTLTVAITSAIIPQRRDTDYGMPPVDFLLSINSFEISCIKRLHQNSESMVSSTHLKLIFNAEPRLIKFHRAYNRILLNANADLSS